MYVLKPAVGEDFIWQKFQYVTAPLDTKYSLWQLILWIQWAPDEFGYPSISAPTDAIRALLHSMCWTPLHKALHHLCRKGVGMRPNMQAKESISKLLKLNIIYVYK